MPTNFWQTLDHYTDDSSNSSCMEIHHDMYDPWNRATPLPPVSPPSPFDKALFKAWRGQKNIGWQQLFWGRISAQWAVAQGIYYASHPDLRDQSQYSSERWSLQVIQIFVESALALWDARNKELHGKSLEEQQHIQKGRVIAAVMQKYQ